MRTEKKFRKLKEEAARVAANCDYIAEKLRSTGEGVVADQITRKSSQEAAERFVALSRRSTTREVVKRLTFSAAGLIKRIVSNAK